MTMHNMMFLVLLLGGCTQPNNGFELSNVQAEPPSGFTMQFQDMVNSPPTDGGTNAMDGDVVGAADMSKIVAQPDMAQNHDHCGSAAIPCTSNETCCANIGCADLTNDVRNCGTCGNFCGVGWHCDNGTCKF